MSNGNANDILRRMGLKVNELERQKNIDAKQGLTDTRQIIEKNALTRAKNNNAIVRVITDGVTLASEKAAALDEENRQLEDDISQGEQKKTADSKAVAEQALSSFSEAASKAGGTGERGLSGGKVTADPGFQNLLNTDAQQGFGTGPLSRQDMLARGMNPANFGPGGPGGSADIEDLATKTRTRHETRMTGDPRMDAILSIVQMARGGKGIGGTKIEAIETIDIPTPFEVQRAQLGIKNDEALLEARKLQQAESARNIVRVNEAISRDRGLFAEGFVKQNEATAWLTATENGDINGAARIVEQSPRTDLQLERRRIAASTRVEEENLIGARLTNDREARARTERYHLRSAGATEAILTARDSNPQGFRELTAQHLTEVLAEENPWVGATGGVPTWQTWSKIKQAQNEHWVSEGGTSWLMFRPNDEGQLDQFVIDRPYIDGIIDILEDPNTAPITRQQKEQELMNITGLIKDRSGRFVPNSEDYLRVTPQMSIAGYIENRDLLPAQLASEEERIGIPEGTFVRTIPRSMPTPQGPVSITTQEGRTRKRGFESIPDNETTRQRGLKAEERRLGSVLPESAGTKRTPITTGSTGARPSKDPRRDEALARRPGPKDDTLLRLLKREAEKFQRSR